MPSIKEDWYCIVNPHAGSGKTMSEWTIAEQTLTELNIPYKTSLTNYKFHATKLAYEAGLHGYRKLLAVGGDGSVHEVMNGIMKYCDETGTDPEMFWLAVIPIGSGNDWIKSTGVPHDTQAVVDLLASNSFDKQDVIKVEAGDTVCYMTNIGGVGFDSHVCLRVNRQKERGKRSATIYATALMHTIRWIRALKGTIKVDGNVLYNGDFYSIALGNGRYSGGGMRQVPKAVMNDGLVDVMVVPKLPVRTLLKEMPRLFNGTLAESKFVLMSRGTVIEVSADRDDVVEMDGEIEGNLPLKVSVTGSSINILVSGPLK